MGITTPENSSPSAGEDDMDLSHKRLRSMGDGFDDDEEPDAKKW